MKKLTICTIGAGLVFFGHIYCDAPLHQLWATGLAFVALAFVRSVEPE